MTHQDEQRRRFDEPRLDSPPPDSGISWGLPLGLAGVAVVLGLIFYNVGSDRTTTASNTGGTAQSTSSAPAPSTPPAAPKQPSR